ncbi:PID-CTERM protein-sorting domain-containing protein [Cognatitamlana onchidii]|uniref:PID-CTERM protein-sorting domain-containing protein n=1 Tax=Cognatitamlana onchidii TaxID=2562860 RepID=UPI0010A63EEE|nr:hypothetical protein [Algibacter onchidii]
MKSKLLTLSKYFAMVLFIAALIVPSEVGATTVDRKEKKEKPQKPQRPQRPQRPKKPKNKKCKNGCRKGCPHTNKSGKSIPLDGGLSILVLGAAAFGVRKLKRK